MNKPFSKKQPILIDDDSWLKSHFEWLIDHYPGQYVVVAKGEAFIGRNVIALERQAREKHPHATTTGMPIPRQQDLFAIRRQWFRK